MAMRVPNRWTLSSAVRSTRTSLGRRSNESHVRTFTSTPASKVVVNSDRPNMRHAQREAEGTLRAPLINPADKYAAKADDLHRYGSWLMGCLPKYIQQFSVWKDELVIYISPAGVVPVFSFLKCTRSRASLSITKLIHYRQYFCRVYPSLGHHRRRLSHTGPEI
jgi:NADH dehydrogenase (ubiquinone) Fe-S protein 3